MLKDNYYVKNNKKIRFHEKFELKSQFNASNTKIKSQLNHMWENALENVCKFGVTSSYWPYFHKPIYIAFKLPNTLPIHNKKPLMSSFW
jgi:hypothetical protein